MRFTSRLISGIFVTAILMAGSSTLATAAENSLTAEVKATSTYLWRGVALTGDAALQASLVMSDPTGIHADLFTSNVFGGSETQIGAGFSGNLNQFKFDVGGRFYYLPQYESSNFIEVYAGISGENFGGKISISPDSGTYLEGYLVLPAFAKWDVALTVGQYSVDEDSAGATIAYDDYLNYSAALITKLEGYDFEIKLSGNSLDDNEAMLPTDTFRTVVSLSKKFAP
ncbi:TorF family putative porin [Kaarinaea lacus]